MQSTRTTRSSVLGKRGHQQQDSVDVNIYNQLRTPDSTPNPKRPRTSTTTTDGDGNKENVPPFRIEAINADSLPVSARATRALRRTTTEIVTPPRLQSASRRRASISTFIPATPTSEISHLSLATPPPTPPTVLLPLHVRAKALLRSTCNSHDAPIAGRDAERDVIQRFLSPFIDTAAMDADKVQSSLFISGSPGTGKTALVNAIIQSLSTNTNDVNVIPINCMALKTVDALYDRLIEVLNPKQKNKGKAKKAKGREALVTSLNKLGMKTILILDELDHITPNTQALSSLFSLSDSIPSMIRIVGIANTHTLTAASSSQTFSTSTNVQTLHFAPYTPTQLQEILQARLTTLHNSDGSELSSDPKKMLPPPAITLLTKKIAGLTGDVRSLFEVLRGAIDLAVSSTPKKENLLEISTPTVTPQHILSALKAYAPSSSTAQAKLAATSTTVNTLTTSSNSEIVTKIRNLSFQSRLVLLTVVLASKRLEASLSLLACSGSSSPKKIAASPIKRTASASAPSTPIYSPGIDMAQLHTYYSAVLSRSDLGAFEPVSRNDFGDLVGMLEGVGLLQLSSSILPSASTSSGGNKGKRAFGRSVSFGAGLGRNGTGAVGEVKLADGVWTDEVLRALGISTSATGTEPTDVRDEEVKAIWLGESARLVKDVKSLAAATSSKTRVNAFDDASED